MKFKIGDKVKFLNTTGGGIVSRILDKSMVQVSIEDGFEIPVMESDIILTGEVADPSANLFRKTTTPGEGRNQQDATDARTGAQQGYIPGRYAGRQLEEGLYLAFRPMDQRIKTFGDLEVMLINYSQVPLIVQLYLRKQDLFHFRKQLNLGTMQSSILAQIHREQLDEWLQGTLQLMVQPTTTAALPLPGHTSFALKGSRFFRADAYENTCLDPQCIVPFLLKPATGLQSSAKAPAKEAAPEKVAAPARPKAEPFIKKHLNNSGDAEVDLHIHALTDKPGQLNPMETLNFQLGYLRKALDSAIVERIPRLIVVHGVGGGILKAEILKIAAEVDFAHTYDAPISQYGIGASIIEFYHTKNR